MTVVARMARPKLPSSLIERVDQPEHRLGDEIEPAPVDQQVELADVQVLFIGVDLADFLGAGEHQGLDGLRLTGRDRDGIRQEVRLIARPAVLEIGEARLEGCLPSGTSATAQYLSVMPSQPSVDFDGVTCLSSSIVE